MIILSSFYGFYHLNQIETSILSVPSFDLERVHLWAMEDEEEKEEEKEKKKLNNTYDYFKILF